MSFSDPLGDMLTRIRNAIMRNRSNVMTPASNLRGRVLDVLADEGFIRGYTETTDDAGFRAFNIEIKYFEGEAVIREIKRVSKPGRRVYSSVKTLPQIRNGLGIAILSTPKGVMSDAAARENNVGGEVLCQVA
jgi:small subunit ribosomal protein S8